MVQHLLSLPPAMAAAFAGLENKPAPDWYAASDPANSKLGSGGGVAHLLHQAWLKNSPQQEFLSWLNESKKLLLMAGGQSRRLPAYAAVGKIMLPFKALRGVPGQRLDQTLLDVQVPAYERVLEHAPVCHRVLVTSGDVLLRFGQTLPQFPEVDVLGLGMWVRPEVAMDFGVFFSRRESPGTLDFFLQKPSMADLQAHSAGHGYLVDTGMWLLSARAVEVLLRRCGWADGGFGAGQPEFYELYAGMGLALGQHPTRYDAEISALSSAVVALPEAEFYHLGTGRQLIASVSAIENREHARGQIGWTGRQPHPDQHILNSHFSIPLRREENHTLWVENSSIPKTWRLASEHVLTGIPANDWRLVLEPGQCLDLVPIGDDLFAIRPYHIDDLFKGPISDPATRWLGEAGRDWFAKRGLPVPVGDIQQAAIFPVLARPDGDFIQWLLAVNPSSDASSNAAQCAIYLAAPLLSAEAICNVARVDRIYLQRRENLCQVLGSFIRNHRWNSFFKLDLERTAEVFAASLGTLPPTPDLEPLDRIHEQSFRAAILRHWGTEDWQAQEKRAFQTMRHLIVEESRLTPANPVRHLLDDQIIWARSPVRLDLAGGWSDTPPYCLEYGGAVLNLAVDLNGQPPIQVFAKLAAASSQPPAILLRSIDLGIEKRLTTYAEIADYDQPEADFSLAKAALALAGFLPRFHATGRFETLREQLLDFGGGIELTFLSAAPKGSGLGTSSILAATTLGALSELCGLDWDRQSLLQRSLALEQLLTTGGGWQDQAGGLYRGMKIIETAPGLIQQPRIRWLPEHLFEQGLRDGTILLFYTGITRMAKNILQEIVRGMFLNSRRHLEPLDAIRQHGLDTFTALQSGNWDMLTAAVRHSWLLNQTLDPGTNPPAVQSILAQIQPHLAAAKLLGAGGGGYLLLFAHDPAAAQTLRSELTLRPPNPTARFVEFSLSQAGLAITRS